MDIEKLITKLINEKALSFWTSNFDVYLQVVDFLNNSNINFTLICECDNKNVDYIIFEGFYKG